MPNYTFTFIQTYIHFVHEINFMQQNKKNITLPHPHTHTQTHVPCGTIRWISSIYTNKYGCIYKSTYTRTHAHMQLPKDSCICIKVSCHLLLLMLPYAKGYVGIFAWFGANMYIYPGTVYVYMCAVVIFIVNVWIVVVFTTNVQQVFQLTLTKIQ